ncbi:MAG: hypothetical protein AAGD04_12705 [Pseudomonadota bacterium]
MAGPLMLSPELLVMVLLGVIGVLFLGLVRSRSKMRAAKALNNRLIEEAKGVQNKLDKSARMQETLQRAVMNASKDSSRALINLNNDLRLPISAVSALFQRIAQDNLTPDQQKNVSRGQSAADAILAKLDLHMATLSSEVPRDEPNRSRASVKELAKDWEQNLAERIAASGKTLAYTVHVTDDAPREFWVDEGRLSKVVERLLNHTVRYSSSGEIGMIVRSHQGVHNTLDIRIVDVGIAMATDTAAAIYERSGAVAVENKGVARRLDIQAIAPLAEALGGRIDVVRSTASATEIALKLDASANLPEGKKVGDVISAA